jgi:hypothetical protein
MAENEPKRARPASYSLTCKAINIPPGQRKKAKHLPDPDVVLRRTRWLMGAGIGIALVAGMLIGRFLLP